MADLNSRFALNMHRGGSAKAPAAHIFLQGIVRHANGMLSVTPICTTLAQLELQIEDLKGELDEVLRQARAAFTDGPRRAPGS